MIDLTTNYLGLSLKNPIVPSSSPLMRKLSNLRPDGGRWRERSCLALPV